VSEYPGDIEWMIYNIDVPLVEVVLAIENWIQPMPSVYDPHGLFKDLDWLAQLDLMSNITPEDQLRTMGDPRRHYEV
jgi:hypothetical protein